MSETIVYMDRSEVRPGALDDLKTAITQLADFVDANQPRILAYNVYLSEDGSQMTVMHVHPDSASLEFHLEVSGPAFRTFADLITLSSIHIYGHPSEKALRQLQEKARLLGRGDVVVQGLHAGFSHFGTR